jgi:SAM-dependent methyltransferase
VLSVFEFAKVILSNFPSLHECILDIKYFNRPLPYNKYQINGTNPEAIFQDILKFNRWNDAESVSGVGSNSNYTINIRSKVPILLRKYDIHSILDAPCGDFAWMKKVKFDPGTSYVGGDIVRELVERLQIDFGSPQRRFIHLDIISAQLPKADILVCRDCFIHLSNSQVLEALRNFVTSDIKYILTTTYRFGRRNADISTGQFRAINLQAAPFSLPPPIETIVDYIYPFPPRRLALWSREQLVAWLHERDNLDADKLSSKSTI